jgi:hypothetical protein
MRKRFLGLAASLLACTVAAAADNAPVAEGTVPSGYVWLSGGVFAVDIGLSWDKKPTPTCPNSASDRTLSAAESPKCAGR